MIDLKASPDLAQAKKLNLIAYIVSTAVIGLVILMRSVKIPVPEGWDASILPPLHATLNGIVAIVLIYGLMQIKKKNFEAHKKAMISATAISALFLLSYVTYHLTTVETKFGGEGTIRLIYFLLLITHVISAAMIFPFILFTLIKAFTNQFQAHKKMASWVYWVWLYVAVTGPICYLMLRPYYG